MNTETSILEYWNRIHAFEKSLEINKNNPEFVFYDGPPFATGLPHYGHLIGSGTKDAVGRYKTMRGFYVRRVWGWDTHGLPIEFEIEKKLGIKTKQQVIDYGIGKYNQACREIVLRFRDQWKNTINRYGRWVDMENDYKTMDPSFMESVWWVFQQLYNKNLIYKGYKVVPYCMRCGTPLSNFEAKDNYQNVSDWSLVVKFKTPWIYGYGNSDGNGSDPRIYLLAWTTTPWSLVTNMLLCVNPDLEYSYVLVNKDLSVSDPIDYGYVLVSDQEDKETDPAVYIVAKTCVKKIFKGKKYKILKNTVKGSGLVGIEYEPVFSYYDTNEYRDKGAFKVVADNYVKTDDGTGIVHCSPAHGEDDYRIGMKVGIIKKGEMPPCPLDDNGNFTLPVTEWVGRNVKNVEKEIITKLGTKNSIFTKGKIVHSYPYCWRSDSPLIYRVCESWYVDVQKIKDNMVKNNQNVSWVPSHIKDGRFGKWLEGATDWCVSRNRFWGTPLPIWTNGSETICIGTVEELERLSGSKPGSITDLHRDSIDQIEIPSKNGFGPLKRATYVFDCWFESGSMPYGQKGYKGVGEVPKAADFIAEGLDQTRGWFYTLMIIGTALTGTEPYKNVVVNGIVLNEKGEKMSKRKKNYPPVDAILDKYGADALRLYLFSTSVVKGTDLRFKEKDISEVKRKYHIMVNNMVKFYLEMRDLYNQVNQKNQVGISIETGRTGRTEWTIPVTTNIMDTWILTCLNDLIINTNKSMDKYDLGGAVNRFFKFINQLSKWYVNLNKNRFKLCNSPVPLQILHICLYYFSLVTAPFAPFLSEIVYQKITNSVGTDKSSVGNDKSDDSIHWHQIPDNLVGWVGLGKSDNNANNATNPGTNPTNPGTSLLELFDYFSDVVDMIRTVRNNRKRLDGSPLCSVKMPLVSITLVHDNLDILNQIKSIENYIRSELNVEEVKYDTNTSTYVSYSVTPNVNNIKKRASGSEIGKIMKTIRGLDQKDINTLVDGNGITVNGVNILSYDITTNEIPKHSNVLSGDMLSLMYDDTVTPELEDKFYSKLFHREYQQSRKDAGILQTDKVILRAYGHNENVINKYYPGLVGDNNSGGNNDSDNNSGSNIQKFYQKDITIEGDNITMKLYKVSR